MTDSTKTIQQLFSLWFWNFQNPSMQQFGNLYNTTIAIMKYYNKEGDYDQEIEKDLPNLFFKPVETLKELFPDDLQINKSIFNWKITQFQFVYHRDTHFRTKLGKEYDIDARRDADRQKMNLATTLLILDLFKGVLFNKIVKIMLDKKIDLYIPLPTGLKEIEQLGGDTHA